MPDISMCASQDCPLRFTCYRNEASGTVPSERQSWAGFEWDSMDGCRYFWENVNAT